MNIDRSLIHKILLIDDDLDDCVVFEQSLKNIRPNTIFKCVSDLEDVVEAVIDYSPDLIFLDINMRPLNGLDYLRAFKEIQTLQSAPIIIYSGSTNKKEIHKAYEHGASLYFIKPKSTEEMNRNLEKVLQMDWKDPAEIKHSFYRAGTYHTL